MYRLDTKDYVHPRFLGLWALLAFQAGFINSLGFLACQRFVSHVTGFGTHVGIAIGKGNLWMAFELFTAPLSFILGAWFNGHFTVARQARNLTPQYDKITILFPIFLGVLMLFGLKGQFGEFGAAMSFEQDAILLNSLTFLCGMQNACFATLTKGQIRTTHLTGISTDIGTDLSLTLAGKLPSEEHQMTIRRNVMRFVTFFGFSNGALISALIDSQLQYWSFLIPVATSSVVAIIFQYIKYEKDKQI